MDANDLLQAITPYTHTIRPILEIREGSARRDAVGTAIVVGQDSTRYVVTAEHVVSGPLQKLIGVSEQNAIPWPRPCSRLAPVQATLPDADVAWAASTVKPEDIALSPPLPLALAVGSLPDAPGSAYVAVGFPGSRAKVRQSEAQLASKMMFAVVEIASRAIVAQVLKDERVQIALRYSQAGRIGLDGEPIVGAHPRGMSGGAIFMMLEGRTANGSVHVFPFLAGVITDFYEKADCIVATRVSHIWQALGLVDVSTPPPLYRRELVS